MKLSITSGAASAIACLAAITRIFYGLIIDSSELYNSAWLCVPIGVIIAFPLFIAIQKIRENMADNNSKLLQKNASVLLILIPTVFECSVSLDGIAHSAAYIGFESIAPVYLMIPLLMIGFLCVCTNGDAIGYSSRIWLKIAPIFLLIIMIVQFPYYRPEWLAPVLGFGWKPIIEGAFKTAGWFSGMCGALLLADAERDHSKHLIKPVKLLFIVMVSATVLIISQLMMSPNLVFANSRSRLYQLDTLLTNGRSNLSIQLPMIIIWFISMAYLWTYKIFIATLLLQKFFPKLEGRLCGIFILLAAIMFIPLTGRDYESMISRWIFPLNGLAVFLLMISLYRRRRLAKA